MECLGLGWLIWGQCMYKHVTHGVARGQETSRPWCICNLKPQASPGNCCFSFRVHSVHSSHLHRFSRPSPIRSKGLFHSSMAESAIKAMRSNGKTVTKSRRNQVCLRSRGRHHAATNANHSGVLSLVLREHHSKHDQHSPQKNISHVGHICFLHGTLWATRQTSTPPTCSHAQRSGLARWQVVQGDHSDVHFPNNAVGSILPEFVTTFVTFGPLAESKGVADLRFWVGDLNIHTEKLRVWTRRQGFRKTLCSSHPK